MLLFNTLIIHRVAVWRSYSYNCTLLTWKGALERFLVNGTSWCQCGWRVCIVVARWGCCRLMLWWRRLLHSSTLRGCRFLVCFIDVGPFSPSSWWKDPTRLCPSERTRLHCWTTIDASSSADVLFSPPRPPILPLYFPLGVQYFFFSWHETWYCGHCLACCTSPRW
jgi:hypothetical protein